MFSTYLQVLRSPSAYATPTNCQVTSTSDNTTAPYTTGELRYCVDLLQNNSGGGEITFDGVSSITLADELPTIIEDTSITGAVTIHGGGSTSDFRALYVDDPAATLALDGLIFRDFHLLSHGGVIYVDDGDLVIDNASFIENYADDSGGAISAGGGLSVSNSVFRENESAEHGGAIYLSDSSADVSITSTVFESNIAGADGGAVQLYFAHDIDIDAVTFDGNEADDDGGALVVYSFNSAHIQNSTFTGNITGGDGGAIYNNDSSDALVVSGSSFYGNEASNGGAITSNHALELTNSFIGGNQAASGKGGAIYTWSGGDVSLLFTTVAVNHKSAGDRELYLGSGDLVAKASIVVADPSDSACGSSGSITVTDSYAIASDTSCQFQTTNHSHTSVTAADILGPLSSAAVQAVQQQFRAPRSGSIPLTDAPNSNLSVANASPDQIGQPRSGAFTIGSIQNPWTPPAPPSPGGGGTTTQIAPPSAPQQVTAVPGAGSVRVAWLPPANDGGSAVTRYVVTASPGSAWCAVDAPTTACVVEGLTAGTPYTFSVVAYNAAGVSPASSASTVVTPNPATDPLGPNTFPGSGLLPAGGLAAGKSLLLVDGKPVPVTVKPNVANVAKATALDVDGPGFMMKLAGRGDVNDPLGLTEKQALILQSEPVASRAGIVGRMLAAARNKVQPVAVSSGSGFMPNSQVKLFLLADTFLGTLPTDANGNYNGKVPVPAGIKPGVYTLQANGFAPGGAVRSLSLGVLVKGGETAQATRKATAEVFFAPLSPALSAQGKATLDKLVTRTGKNGVRTVVVGFVQPVGTTANDAWLSQQRAQTVAQYLRGKGLKGAYSVKGNGRATETGAEARRVEVTVTYRR